MDLFPFVPGYTQGIYQSGREAALVMLLSFLVTFLCARGYTRLARTRDWGSASVGGVHAHHLVFGVIIAFLGGALEFGFQPDQASWAQLLFAAMFGAGVALVLDEFALLFHLQDVYWEREGRKSVDAIVLGALFGAIFLLQITPLGDSGGQTRSALAISLVVNLLFVIAAAVKGKLYLAVFGVFMPILAIVGAIRLAEPGSIWARHRYTTRPKKLRRSQVRYKHYEQIWRPRWERARDFLGGKPGRHVSRPHK